jgi:hypothetical protein
MLNPESENKKILFLELERSHLFFVRDDFILSSDTLDACEPL